MINCIAIDDEPLALKQLESYIKKTPFLNLISPCHSAMEALQIINNEQVDLIITDINMPDCDGLQFVRSLVNPPLIVFSTAYEEYAIDSYRLDAIDYLLKPYSYQDFLKVALKVKQYYEWKRLENKDVMTTPEAYIFIRSGNQNVRVFFDNILYIEGMSEYIRIHLLKEKPLMPFLSIKLILEALPANRFMRVHRSYVVALDRIESFRRMELVLEGGVVIPVSASYKEDLQHFIDQRSITKMPH